MKGEAAVSPDCSPGGQGTAKPTVDSAPPAPREAGPSLSVFLPAPFLPFWVPSAAAAAQPPWCPFCARAHGAVLGRCGARGSGESVPGPLPDAARPSGQSPTRAIHGRTVPLTTHTFLLIPAASAPKPAPPPASGLIPVKTPSHRTSPTPARPS